MNHPAYAEIPSLFAEKIRQQMQSLQIPGLSLALVDNQDVIWADGFGFADQEQQIPAGADTIYHIGSITKLFTATAIMQLVEQGKLDLDAPLQDTIPEFAIKSRFPDTPPITTRLLMTHHSGIPNDKLSNYFSEDEEAFQAIVPYLRTQYLTCPPNSIFSYSNLAVDVLGVVISRLSGMPYWQYIETHLLAPLEMAHSAARSGALLSNRARGYEHSASSGIDEMTMRDTPAGCMVSTATDMAQFIKMLLAGGTYDGTRIVQKETLERMWTIQNAHIPLDLNFRIGLNWMLGRSSLDYAGDVCWHDGGTAHFFSVLVLLPAHKLGAIILTNAATGVLYMHQLADDLLQHALRLKTGITPPQPTPHKLPTCPLREGDYATLKGIMSIGKKEGGFCLGMSGAEFMLVPDADNWYSLPNVPATRVTTQTINRESILAMEQRAGQMVLQSAMGKQFLPHPIPPLWETMVGKYKPLNDDGAAVQSLEIQLQGQVLSAVALLRKLGRVQLIIEPYTDSEGIILGLGRFAGETLFLRENGTFQLFGLVFAKQ